MLRAAYAKDLRMRFKEIQRLIRVTIVDNDALFLSPGPRPFQLLPAPADRFDFATSPDKVAAFMTWLRDAIKRKILDDFDPELEGFNPYILRAMRAATERADLAMVRSGFVSGLTGIETLIPATMPQATARTLSILSTRNFEELKGITEAMSQGIARDLSEGVLRGIGPRQIAKTLNKTVQGIGIVRSNLLARTEVINAYAETSLDRYEQWGVQEVTARVEFATARDDRVCEICAGYDGRVLSIEDARGLIPVHPLCRCAWQPVSIAGGGALALSPNALRIMTRPIRTHVREEELM